MRLNSLLLYALWWRRHGQTPHLNLRNLALGSICGNTAIGLEGLMSFNGFSRSHHMMRSVPAIVNYTIPLSITIILQVDSADPSVANVFRMTLGFCSSALSSRHAT